MFIDWHQFHLSQSKSPPVVDSRRRLRICLAAFVALVLVVFGRAAQLEVTQGAAFRGAATKPLARPQVLPGVRGRILARDGTVLACDKKILALAVQYRYLQQPADARWLRLAARARLSPGDRKNSGQVAVAEARLEAERAELCRRLARLCGLSQEEWEARARRVQARVEQIAQSANDRRHAAQPFQAADRPAQDSLPGQLGRLILDTLSASLDDPAPPRITVAEELDYHVMAEDLPLGVVAEIEATPQQYPAVKIVTRTRRTYPCGSLAAHVLGHLGPVEPEELGARKGVGCLLPERPATNLRSVPGSAQKTPDPFSGPDHYVGRMGLERQYEPLLRGRPGLAVERADHAGRLLSTVCLREPGVGRDLVLTLDCRLQRAAEELLDGALRRRLALADQAEPAGGAIVVMDVHSGALRAAASAPRFDPNWFAAGKSKELAALLGDPGHPLFDRASRMAIPPGSVFKTVAAIALLESAAVEPQEALTCQGYWHQPDQQRCEIYVRYGVGHGEVTLADALCKSCNVYFFHGGAELGPAPLVDWAQRLGVGTRTGIDLPGEAAGTLPTPENIQALEGHAWQTADTEFLSIGQGSLRATPLQMACLMAAVANGGQLVTPRLLSGLGLPSTDGAERRGQDELPQEDREESIRVPPPRPIPGLTSETLEVVRGGLQRVVCDPEGTAHGTVYLESIAIAGKTGTAETGEGRSPHAWFAGYAPAERPRFAFVVVLEHAGSGAAAAGPVVKRLVLRMQQLKML
jgi:penicillin-binding protein 2